MQATSSAQIYTCFLLVSWFAYYSTLKNEAIIFLRNVGLFPEDCTLHSHRRENLKSNNFSWGFPTNNTHLFRQRTNQAVFYFWGLLMELGDAQTGYTLLSIPTEMWWCVCRGAVQPGWRLKGDRSEWKSNLQRRGDGENKMEDSLVDSACVV
jgi:hypothetical protein